MVDDSTAELLINDSMAKTLSHFIQEYEPYRSLRRLNKKEGSYQHDKVDLTPFKDRNGASVVRNVVVFTSKSGAAFADAMDVFFELETYTIQRS